LAGPETVSHTFDGALDGTPTAKQDARVHISLESNFISNNPPSFCGFDAPVETKNFVSSVFR